MSKPAVLLIGPLIHCNKEWSDLGKKYNLLEYREGNRTEFIANLKSGTYDTVSALYRSNTSVPVTGPFDAALLSHLPPSLKYICHNGAGYDNIDVPAFTARSIGISSTPIAVDDATGDTAIFLMLGALRQAHVPIFALRAGHWKGNSILGHDPRGKTLGILGMGGIGRAIAHRARAFGCKIIYHNRSRLSPELEGDATYVSFNDLLSTSDILSLSLSLTPATKHIISTPQFSLMKKGVTIINTARGGLIDEAALVTALESGQVGAAGLDVYENEPEIHPGLIKNEKAFLVPHIGTSTWETQREMELLVLRNLESAIEGRGLLTPVAEQKGMHFVMGREEGRGKEKEGKL